MKAKKHFGQNFLNDEGIISLIVSNIVNVYDHDSQVIEIGPGRCAITLPLLDELGSLDVIEIDHSLYPRLRDLQSKKPGLTLHEQDVLNFDFAKLAEEKNSTLQVCGNLPYNISTPILFKLYEYSDLLSHCHFMLQKEVVDRITATPGGKNYGRLSVMLQTRFEAEKLFEIPPEAFDPAPKVQSAVIRLTPYSTPKYAIGDEAFFSKVVQLAFGQRRKTLANALKPLLNQSIKDKLGDYLSQRAEQLEIAQFVDLANTLKMP